MTRNNSFDNANLRARFAEHLRDRAYSPQTVNAYDDILKQVSFDLISATTAELTVWLAAEHGRVAPRALALRVACLRRFFRFLTEQSLRPDHPAKGLQSVRIGRGQPHPIAGAQTVLDALTTRARACATADKETDPLLSSQTPERAVALRARNQALFALLLTCGLRIGEACLLDVADADLPTGLITVRHGKGDTTRRVPLRGAKEALTAYLAVRENLGPKCPALFLSQRGARLDTTSGYRIVAQAGQTAGVRCRPHALRHTFATDLADRNLPLTVLSKLLGHRSVRTTLIYAGKSEAKLAATWGHFHPRAKLGLDSTTN